MSGVGTVVARVLGTAGLLALLALPFGVTRASAAVHMGPPPAAAPVGPRPAAAPFGPSPAAALLAPPPAAAPVGPSRVAPGEQPPHAEPAPHAPPRTNPAPGARLAVPPSDVTIALAERPEAAAEVVVMVTDAAGVRRDTGAPRVSGSVVTVDLVPDLGAGTYTVDWWVRPPRTAAAGGTTADELSGTFLFTLVEPPAEPAGALLAVAGSDRTAPFWIAAALLLAVAAAAVVHRRRSGHASQVRGPQRAARR